MLLLRNDKKKKKIAD